MLHHLIHFEHLAFHPFNCHSCKYTIETEPAEPEPELQEELAQAEVSANPDHAQGKPRCISPIILVFYFESLLYNKLDCALSLYELIGIIVALCLPFRLSLITL
jgi:hypothetical protein